MNKYILPIIAGSIALVSILNLSYQIGRGTFVHNESRCLHNYIQGFEYHASKMEELYNVKNTRDLGYEQIETYLNSEVLKCLVKEYNE